MRVIALRHTGGGLAFRILNQKTALRAFHEHDEGDDNNNHDDEGQNNESRQRALTTKFQCSSQCAWQFSNDTGENNKRNAVTDTARGHLLTEPHQKNRAADKCNNRAGAEEKARLDHDALRAFQANGNTIALHRSQNHRAIARVLVDLLASGLAFFFQLFQTRHN